jgi:hypothetical protein
MSRVEAERRQGLKIMEEHLYQSIYDIQQSDILPEEKLSALNRCKTKLVRLQARRMEKLMKDNTEHDKIQGVEATLFHVLKTKNGEKHE